MVRPKCKLLRRFKFFLRIPLPTYLITIIITKRNLLHRLIESLFLPLRRRVRFTAVQALFWASFRGGEKTAQRIFLSLGAGQITLAQLLLIAVEIHWLGTWDGVVVVVLAGDCDHFHFRDIFAFALLRRSPHLIFLPNHPPPLYVHLIFADWRSRAANLITHS
jgi:hypothetical protein